ncbi:cell division protein ZipA [Nitrincola tibetensis]|uniref:Cell division protein ZipA n=1 Tax=Nitrincola tibetensis TaxID=2219697 RepID=A0A364NHY1_9GAMM|nr:cell division protein ZipA [Nitrincola tibetensis]RAU16686.1 cell division protein ZipA [Nitrincola tibetensis]
MEISLREWLIIGGVLLIALILFDGWRRVRVNRNKLRIDIDKTLSDLSEDYHNPELPNGGARIRPENDDFFDERTPEEPKLSEEYREEPKRQRGVSRAEPAPAKEPRPNISKQPSPQMPTSRRQEPEYEKTATPEPMQDPYAEAKSYIAPERDKETSSVSANETRDLSELDPLFDDIPAVQSRYKQKTDVTDINLPLDLDFDKPIPVKRNGSSVRAPVHFDGNAEDEKAINRSKRRPVENPSFSLPLDIEPPKPSQKVSPIIEEETQDLFGESAGRSRTEQAVEPAVGKPVEARKTLEDLPDPAEVLVITVVGKDKQNLHGGKLHAIVEACGMEFGDMSIFHRFEGKGRSTPVQFSMANAVNPGIFDVQNMDSLQTPAVSFFMSMREPKDPMTAYECMLATAETVAKHLEGDLLDEDRSVMREQTKEHYRQRIRDFEMENRRPSRIR